MASGAKAPLVVNIIARTGSQGKSTQFGVEGSCPTTIFWGGRPYRPVRSEAASLQPQFRDGPQVDRSWARRKEKTDATASTIPFTSNSHGVACLRIQMMATIASAGTIFILGKLKGGAPSARTSRCTKNQHAAQQSRYIRRTATLESTASFSNVPVMDRAKASTAYVMIATSGER